MPRDAFDLVSIGGGFAGLVAAVRGTQLGLRSALLEQGVEGRYPCSSRLAGGVFHVSYNNVTLEKAALLTAIMRATGGEADPAQAEAVAGTCGRVVEWLKREGAPFTHSGPADWRRWVLAPPRQAVAGPDWLGRGPDRLLERLSQRLAEHGGAFFRGTRARALRLKNGRTIGVVARRDEVEVKFSAAAVVIADGGFPANSDLFRQHIGPRPERVLQRNAGTAQGDGLVMAQEAGAAISRLDRFYGHLLSRDAMTNEGLSPYPQLDAVAAAGIVVDAGGRRILDEGLGGISIANALARRDDPLAATVICDARIWESAGRDHLIPPNPLLERAGGRIHRADAVAALARAAGLSESGLAETVAAYNAAVAAGALASLRPARSAKSGPPAPISEPPFLAIPLCAGITNTMGGILIDGDGRALRGDGSAIEGLYAAGGATGGLEGGGALGYVGGLIKACVFGLRAAEHAAKGRRAAF
jgi:succinate dehydrogenase/fumarate reductase flavoprotein subunit